LKIVGYEASLGGAPKSMLTCSRRANVH